MTVNIWSSIYKWVAHIPKNRLKTRHNRGRFKRLRGWNPWRRTETSHGLVGLEGIGVARICSGVASSRVRVLKRVLKRDVNGR